MVIQFLFSVNRLFRDRFIEAVGRVAPIGRHFDGGLRSFTEFTVDQPLSGLVEEIDQVLFEPFIDVAAGQQAFSYFIFLVFDVVLGIFFFQLKEFFEVFNAIIVDI